MDSIDRPLALLGGLSPAHFMRKHWQKQPLLVRQNVEVPPNDLAPVKAHHQADQCLAVAGKSRQIAIGEQIMTVLVIAAVRDREADLVQGPGPA